LTEYVKGNLRSLYRNLYMRIQVNAQVNYLGVKLVVDDVFRVQQVIRVKKKGFFRV